MTTTPAPEHPTRPDNASEPRQRGAGRARSVEDRRHVAMVQAAKDRRTVTARTRSGAPVTGVLSWWPHPDRKHRGRFATVISPGGRHYRIVADLDTTIVLDDQAVAS